MEIVFNCSMWNIFILWFMFVDVAEFMSSSFTLQNKCIGTVLFYYLCISIMLTVLVQI